MGTTSQASARVEELLQRLDATTAPPARAALLFAIGRTLQDELDDDGEAAEAFLEAWALDPSIDGLLEAMEGALRRTGRIAEAVRATEALAQREADRARALIFEEALVRWLTRELHATDDARRHLARVRALDATHSLVHLAQAAVYREQGDLKREIAALDMAVLSARYKDDRARIHLLMADRYGDARLFDAAAAKKHLWAAHKLFPTTAAPLVALDRLFTSEKDIKGLVEVLRKYAIADVPVEDRVRALVRLAEIEERELRKPELAAATLEAAYDLDPTDDEVTTGLERTYQAARAWGKLAAFLEASAATAPSTHERVARLRRLGEVLETKLGDPAAATAAYERIADASPADETVLAELSRLSEKQGDLLGAAHWRERLAYLARDGAARARGLLAASQLVASIDEAIAHGLRVKAFEADPTSVPAFQALVESARASGDSERLVRYYEQRALATETPRARAACLVALAEILEELGLHDRAEEAYGQAAAADPTNEAAACALLETLVADGRFEEAATLAPVALAAAERDGDKDRLYAYLRAAMKIELAVGSAEHALAYATAAFDLRPDAPEMREEIVDAARAAEEAGVSAESMSRLESIAEEPRDLSSNARIRLAGMLSDRGREELAATLYDSVIAENAERSEALQGLADVKRRSGDRVAALALERQLAQTLEDRRARFDALVACGDAMVREGTMDAVATDVYEEARALDPLHLPTLHKILDMCRRLERWPRAVEILTEIARADGDPARRAKTLFVAGQIARDELADRARAIKLFEQALDADPSRLEAFERIVRLLTDARDWLALEAMYKRMILRAVSAGDRVQQHELYKQIGVLYRDPLKNTTLAEGAFRAAVDLRPDSDEARMLLSDVLARSGRSEGAATVGLELVLRRPLDPQPYPAVFDLLASQRDRDRAFRVASVMKTLGVHHPPAAHVYEAIAPRPLDTIHATLGAEGWRALVHPDLDPDLTEILAVVAPAVAELAQARLSLFERKAHPGPRAKDHPLEPLAARAAAVLGTGTPRVCLARPGAPTVSAAAAWPPALLVAPMAGALSPQVVAFLMGRRVMEVEASFFARVVCPTVGELKTLVASAARIGRGQGDASDAPLRGKLTRSQASLLTAAVERAMTRTEPLDVKRWLRYADATCSRAGLLLAGDLDAARTVLASERQLPGELSPRDKLAELIEFFLGDGYAGLRARLGTSVPASMAPPPMQESAPTSLPAPPPLPSLRPPWTKR